jgi:hypothetical protein
MTRCFLRLFIVIIFPKAADQTKKVAFKGILVHQTLFKGERKPSLQTKTLSKDLTSHNPLLEGANQSLSLPSCLTLTEYNTLKNEAMTSTSQSWAALVNLMFHLLEPPKSSKWVATEASFAQAISYKSGKASFKAITPHYDHARI